MADPALTDVAIVSASLAAAALPVVTSSSASGDATFSAMLQEMAGIAVPQNSASVPNAGIIALMQTTSVASTVAMSAADTPSTSGALAPTADQSDTKKADDQTDSSNAGTDNSVMVMFGALFMPQAAGQNVPVAPKGNTDGLTVAGTAQTTAATGTPDAATTGAQTAPATGTPDAANNAAAPTNAVDQSSTGQSQTAVTTPPDQTNQASQPAVQAMAAAANGPATTSPDQKPQRDDSTITVALKAAAAKTAIQPGTQTGTQSSGAVKTDAKAKSADTGRDTQDTDKTVKATDTKSSDPADSQTAASADAGKDAGFNLISDATARPQNQQQTLASDAKPDPNAALAASTTTSPDTTKIAAEVQVATQPRHQAETASTLDKLGVTIAARSLDGQHQFDIRLDPPELGRLQVHLTVDNAGQAQATVIADKQQTLELLQRDAQSLNRALTDAGLNLSNNGLNFSLREQYRQNEDGGVDKGRGRSLSAKAVVQTDANSIRAASVSYAPNSARLDIRV